MKEKTIINRILWVFAALFLAVLVCFQSIPIPAFAAETGSEYTDVMTDLQSDSDFNASDYPAVADDYSLQVIQIAESVNGELFVYVYQPSASTKKLTASSINISTGIRNDLKFYNYGLTLLSQNGVFQKYVVNDFSVLSKHTRYYEISGIYRVFDENLDDELNDDNDNTINEVVFDVSKLYCYEEVNEELTVTVSDIETIKITDKYVGFVRYESGSTFWGTTDSCDGHFVAFSTDRQIDELLEADVYFQTQSVMYQPNGSVWEFGEIADNYSYMTDTSHAFYQSEKDFWYNYEYSWQRIQTVDEFLDSQDFTMVYEAGLFNVEAMNQMDEEAANIIKQQQWVLRFFESTYTFEPGFYGGQHFYTNVSNVSILRLAFETNGKYYNLGVVDNKQTGSSDPDNDMDIKIKPNGNWWLIIAVIAVILLFVVLSPILTPIVSIVIDVVSIPFKWIGDLFKGGKKK